MIPPDDSHPYDPQPLYGVDDVVQVMFSPQHDEIGKTGVILGVIDAEASDPDRNPRYHIEGLGVYHPWFLKLVSKPKHMFDL